MNDLLKKLSMANGTPGNEKQIRDIFQKELSKTTSEITGDNLGSIVGVLGNKGPRILLASHMDEVGFIVKEIDDKGYLKFVPSGGWTPQVLSAQQVTITTMEGQEYIGVIGSLPPHLLSPAERSKLPEIKEMFIDIGISSKEEVEKLGIQVGDMITPKIEATELADSKYLLGKAWDNRVGCYIVIEVMKRLKGKKLDVTVYGGATTQEEIGLRGATTLANKIQPDIAIAIDTGIPSDTPGAESRTTESILGKGPQILLKDGRSVTHIGLRDYIMKIAEKKEINLQPTFLAGGSTDAAAFNITHSGVPSVPLLISTRYIHSHTSVIHSDDVENLIELVVEVIESLNENTVKEIKEL